MRFLISGFPKYSVDIDLKPSIERRGFYNIDYLVIPDRIEAQKTINKCKDIDLMILGWTPAKDFELHNPSSESEYSQYREFARNNPKIPSILIVDNMHHAVLRNLEHLPHPPPDKICYWSKFGEMNRQEIGRIIHREF